ncbi:hypothetical protein OS493_035971 [Desmophyllum pertusum]|uniref:Uncharacterized protein n=1 Tax=Desmophyllum pertusum TaxID=174260 RepID=A0A9X0CHX6_9CNID|nr:hypothetical protein OS493_035971 [Desmophyllum pertusum]
MKISHAKVLITFLFYIDTAFPETIEIIRSMPDGERTNWKKGVDSVHIPQSVCYQDSGGYGHFCNTSCDTDDHGHGRYSCACSNDNATVTYLNNKWRCLENQEVRNQLGCETNTLFAREKKKHRLYTLDAKQERKTRLKRQASCAINISSSWYIGCFGEKVPLGEYTNRTKEIFILLEKSSYHIKVKNVKPIDIFQGRVINLHITCSTPPSTSNIKEGCLLFKLEGKITCNSGPVETPTITSFSSSIAPTMSSMETKLTVSLSATTYLKKATASATIGPSQALTRPSSRGKQKNDDVSSSNPLPGIIAGVTVSMTLVLLLIAALFIYRRYKSRKDAHTSTEGQIDKNSVARNPKTNAAFQLEAQNACVTNNDNEPFAPIYTSNYDVPRQQILRGTSLNQKTTPTEENSQSDNLYAALNIPDGLNIYGPVNTQGPVYNALRDLASNNEERFQTYGSICTDQPVYNVLEDLSGRDTVECLNNGPNEPEPVYNVLEDPYAEGSEGPAYYGATPGDDPVYNTLEESHYHAASPCTSEPVYNVLEGPFLSGAEEC